MQSLNFLPFAVVEYSLSRQTISDGSVSLVGLQLLSHGEPGVVRNPEESWARRRRAAHLETDLRRKPDETILTPPKDSEIQGRREMTIRHLASDGWFSIIEFEASSSLERRKASEERRKKKSTA